MIIYARYQKREGDNVAFFHPQFEKEVGKAAQTLYVFLVLKKVKSQHFFPW